MPRFRTNAARSRSFSRSSASSGSRSTSRLRRSQYAPSPLPIRILRYLGKLYLILTIVHLLLTQFFIQPFYVETASMDPALIAGQTVLVSPLPYGFNLGFLGAFPMWSLPHRGDIVAFPSPVMEPKGFFREAADLVFRIFFFGARPPWEPSEPSFASSSLHFRRVVGLPGDKVRMQNGQYFVLQPGQTEFLPERQVQLPLSAFDSSILEEVPFGSIMPELTVPEGTVYVASDRRGMFLDSSNYGPVRFTELRGRVFFRLRPLSEAGPIR